MDTGEEKALTHADLHMLRCKMQLQTNLFYIHAYTFLHAFPGPSNEEISFRDVSQCWSPWK